MTIKTTAVVEEELSMTLNEIAECGDYDQFLEAVADRLGYPSIQNMDVEPFGIVDIGGGVKKVRIKVTGEVEVREDEAQSQPPA